MPKLLVRNFGPIGSGLSDDGGFYSFERFTILTGEQGSGKSSVLKLYSTCRWLEKALFRGDMAAGEINKYNRFRKKHVAFQGISDYFQSSTEIVYVGAFMHLHYTNGKAEITLDAGKQASYQPAKLMYVPAERNVLALVDDADKLKRLPLPLYTFLEEYDRVRTGSKGALSLPIGGFKYEFNRQQRISYVLGDKYRVKLANASSGLQSLIPLYLVSKDLGDSFGNEKDRSLSSITVAQQRRFEKAIASAVGEDITDAHLRKLLGIFLPNRSFVNLVEEPEQNLYPTSQRDLLYALIEICNRHQGNELALTTHSPFVIDYLSLAMKVGEIVARCGTATSAEIQQVLPGIQPVNAAEIAIYELEANGTAKRLALEYGLPSGDNELNVALTQTNLDFDRLLEIEERICGV